MCISCQLFYFWWNGNLVRIRNKCRATGERQLAMKFWSKISKQKFVPWTQIFLNKILLHYVEIAHKMEDWSRVFFSRDYVLTSWWSSSHCCREMFSFVIWWKKTVHRFCDVSVIKCFAKPQRDKILVEFLASFMM